MCLHDCCIRNSFLLCGVSSKLASAFLLACGLDTLSSLSAVVFRLHLPGG